MQNERITAQDAAFLKEIFSIPEYDLYFAENGTTAEEWAERIRLFGPPLESDIVCTGDGKKIGWLMYEIKDGVLFIHILVLHPDERKKGYGSVILSDLKASHPEIRTIRLDVQQRNKAALAFYEKHGFTVTGEETQPVGSGKQPYFKLERNRKNG